MSPSGDPGLPDSILSDLGFPVCGPGRSCFSLLPTGPFHPGRVWRWTNLVLGESRLLKGRPDNHRNQEHSLLAWQLASHSHWPELPGFPRLIHQEKPWVEYRGWIYQAWTWIAGNLPDSANFQVGLALEQLNRFSELARRTSGELQGVFPCVKSREKAIIGWLECEVKPPGELEKRCADLLAEWGRLALAALGKMPLSGPLRLCHGDPWLGNWLVIESDFGSPKYGLIDWSTVRWDHPASDRARLIGSAGKPIRLGSGDETDPDGLLAWTGHVAALCNWMIKRKDGPWKPEAKGRVEWILGRLEE